jgi:hypothetical protein
VSEPPIADLAELIGDLESAAAELRTGDLDAEGAATLVERCADLAGSIASELDRQVRELESEPPDQESLL